MNGKDLLLGHGSTLNPLGATDGVLETSLRNARQKAKIDDAVARLASRTAVRPKDHREAGIVRVDPKMAVRILPAEPGEDNYRGFVFSVQVHSLMVPGNFKAVRIHPLAPMAVFQAAAGAACEELCEANRDPFDPEWAANNIAEHVERARRHNG